jgi:hypothetical protein
MYNTTQEVIDSYRAAPEIYTALLADCTQEQAQAARGGDEGWSVVEVMCHMRDAEEVALMRMRAMRDNDNPRVAGYDQEAWARERNYAASDLQEALDAFLKLRAQHVTELEALSKEDWERPGEHSEYGRITLMGHALHMAYHDVAHAAQIARQLSGS